MRRNVQIAVMLLFALNVFGDRLHLEGETKASYDGGDGQTKNLKQTPATACSGCSGECVTITGTLEITYSVKTTVTRLQMTAAATAARTPARA